jgi:hypothetical protein
MNRIRPNVLRMLIVVFAGIEAMAPSLALSDELLSLTMNEIRALEEKVRMPRGAAPLRKYVRYYYSVAQPEGVRIAGIYVARSWLAPSEIPAGNIAIVAAASDISVPEDAGCSVVFVSRDRGDTSPVTASCSAELVKEP